LLSLLPQKCKTSKCVFRSERTLAFYTMVYHKNNIRVGYPYSPINIRLASEDCKGTNITAFSHNDVKYATTKLITLTKRELVSVNFKGTNTLA
jgi:hypothetical protein